MAEVRKLYAHSRTLVVSIPKRWTKALGLKPGDVTLLELAPGPKIILSLVSASELKEFANARTRNDPGNKIGPVRLDTNTSRADPY